MKIVSALLLCTMLLTFSSCKKEEEEPVENTPTTYAYSDGMLVSCEGAFGSNNASVSWISPEGEVRQNIFAQVNGFGLGDVLQSITSDGNHAYMVVNNSQKVEVVNAHSFESAATITGVDYPRYMLQASDSKMFLSNGAMDGTVYVIDKQSNTIMSSIQVGNGPEQMTLANGKVFVANSGGWTTDHTVSVIDIQSENVTATIDVGDRPTSMITDHIGDVWVLCAGEVEYDENWNVVGHTSASLQRIDPVSDQVEQVVEIGELGDHPTKMAFDPFAQRILIATNGITSVSLDGTISNLSSSPCSSITVNPVGGDIFTTSVSDFVSNSEVYQLDTDGNLITSYTVGIGANQVLLN